MWWCIFSSHWVWVTTGSLTAPRGKGGHNSTQRPLESGICNVGNFISHCMTHLSQFYHSADAVQFLSCVQHINYHVLVNMKYSVIQRVFIVETCIRMKSHKKYHCKFRSWIPGVSFLSTSTFYQLWTNFGQQFPSLKKQEWTQCVLSKERLEHIWRAFRGIYKKYIKIIHTYSHTTASFETRQI